MLTGYSSDKRADANTCQMNYVARHPTRSPQTQKQSARFARAVIGGRPAVQYAAAASSSASGLTDVRPGVKEGYWQWKGHNIRYQCSGDSGEPVVLVHGFGGNCDHWRKNTPILGQKLRAYAIDLLGYGFSDKPDPRRAPPNSIYNFDTWGQQLVDFVDDMIGEPTYLSCNSVGGLAGLSAAIARPDIIAGVQLLNMSLRGLHVERQLPWQRPVVTAVQRMLKDTPMGAAFFNNVATPRTVKTILCQAYCNDAAVTDELVDCILKPGLQPGAVQVFLDFISYSAGPLPERLLAGVPEGIPVSILWGADDPWEDIKEGRRLFAHHPCVTEFVELPGVGHCPQDEAPEKVNPLIERFVLKSRQRKAAGSSSSSVEQSDIAQQQQPQEQQQHGHAVVSVGTSAAE